MSNLLDNIAEHIPGEDSFELLFEDLSLVFYLYMGHTVLVMNKNNGIKNVI